MRRARQISGRCSSIRSLLLASGDFVSYLVVRKDREFDHEFRKEAAPELTAKEIEDIDSLVDEILE